VRVRDNGIGIAADQLDRIFEIFTQVDTSPARTQTGLGLGLSLVKDLVELHGGHVEARSEGLDKGSEFIVRLPTIAEPAEPAEPGPAAPVALLSGHRVLVVDDNVDAADSLAVVLKLAGNEVHTRYDGIEAVSAAAELQPDVVLLDIGMPGLDGYEACRRIRGQDRGSSRVVIALTGWGQVEDRMRSDEAGFDAHVVKPVRPETLMDLIARLLPMHGYTGRPH
jgi:CheY-like chemotaxis protein